MLGNVTMAPASHPKSKRPKKAAEERQQALELSPVAELGPWEQRRALLWPARAQQHPRRIGKDQRLPGT
jgi:hypothetical protein